MLHNLILAFGFLAMVLAPAIIAMRTGSEEEKRNTKNLEPPASTATHAQLPTSR